MSLKAASRRRKIRVASCCARQRRELRDLWLWPIEGLPLNRLRTIGRAIRAMPLSPMSLAVPSIRLVEDDADHRPHAAYEVEVALDGQRFSTWRRWSECRAFAARLSPPGGRRVRGFFQEPPRFPDSQQLPNLLKAFTNADLDGAFLERRRAQLEEYFAVVLQLAPSEALEFLTPREDEVVLRSPAKQAASGAAAIDALIARHERLEAADAADAATPEQQLARMSAAASRLQSAWLRRALRFSPSPGGETPMPKTPAARATSRRLRWISVNIRAVNSPSCPRRRRLGSESPLTSSIGLARTLNVEALGRTVRAAPRRPSLRAMAIVAHTRHSPLAGSPGRRTR